MSGKPASRISDRVAGGVIVQGSRTVLIGSQGGVACSACPDGVTVGNPVNPLLGAKVLGGEIDISLPGPLPFIIARDYSSYQTNTPAPVGLLGPGWWLPAEASLYQRGDVLTLNDIKGRSIRFGALSPGEMAHSRSENLWIVRGGLDRLDTRPENPIARLATAWQGIDRATRTNSAFFFVTSSPLGPWWIFSPREGCGDIDGKRLPLQGIGDRFGRLQRFGYTRQSEHATAMTLVQDGAGRRYQLELATLPGLANDGQQGWGADNGVRLAAIHLIHDPHHPGTLDRPLARYEYTLRGELAAVFGRDGARLRQFEYHPELVGRMSAHAHAGRPMNRYAYDKHGRVIEQISPEALSYRFDYQPDNTTVTDSLGRKRIYHFQGQGGLRRVVKLEQADGSMTENRFDTSGRLIAHIDPLGRETRYELDVATGSVLSITLPDGTQRKIEYNQYNDVVQIDHAERLQYDALGRLVAQTDALDQTTRYHYPDEHTELPSEIEDAKGGRKKLTWSPFEHLAVYTDCSGSTTRYQRDRWGQLIAVRGEENLLLNNEYDSLGRLIARTNAAAQKTTYRYNAAGDLIGTAEPDNNEANFERDAWGQLTAFHYAGHTQRYQYDAAGRLTVLTNENGASTRFQYDAVDRLIEQTGFDGRTHRYAYNSAGELTESADANLHRRYRYDQGGRLVGCDTSADETVQQETFHYDPSGRLTEARHGTAIGGNQVTVRLARDALGRVTLETQQLTNSENHAVWQHQVHHRYDELGVEAQTTLDALPPLHWQTYGSGHLHGLTLDRRSLIDFERDKLHREIERNFAGTRLSRSYDALSHLSRIETHSPQIAEQINRLHHYDQAGHLTRIDTAQGSHRYDYDKAGRLIEAQLPNQAAQTYRFDPAGNRLFTHRLTDTAQQDWAETVRHNLPNPDFNVLGRNRAQQAHRDETCWPANRIDDDGQYHYQYDEHGNLTLKHKPGERHLYAYDTDHRLTRYVLETDTAVRASTYFYDPFGRRIAKQTLHADENGTPIGDIDTTWYGWDGDRLVTTEHGGRKIHTVYQPDSFVPLVRIETDDAPPRLNLAQKIEQQSGIALERTQTEHLEAIEQELRQDELSEQNAQWLRQAGLDPVQLKAMLDEEQDEADRTIHLYHCDHLGTPLALIDEKGKVDWRIELDAWGNTLKEHNPNDLYQPIRLQGQFFDPESGLHYNRHRYYDPKIGRYVTQDPIGLKGGINIYAHVHNNPLSFVDPEGLEVSICRRPADIIGGLVDHAWVRTDTMAAGLGGDPNVRPGDAYEAPFITRTYVLDHSKDTPTSCEKMNNVDEECVNGILTKELGTYQGRFGPYMNCQGYAYSVVNRCRYGPQMLPEDK